MDNFLLSMILAPPIKYLATLIFAYRGASRSVVLTFKAPRLSFDLSWEMLGRARQPNAEAFARLGCTPRVLLALPHDRYASDI